MYIAYILSISYYSSSLPTTTTEMNEYASCAYCTFRGVNILEKSAVYNNSTNSSGMLGKKQFVRMLLLRNIDEQLAPQT